MNIDHLREFVYLAETLSFAATARHFFISASVLSKHVSALEDDLQVKLFVRGVKVHEEGLYQIGEERWTDIFMPIFTDLCDTCAMRRAAGEELPTCVKHCQAHVLKFGELEDLARDLAAKPKQVLYAL